MGRVRRPYWLPLLATAMLYVALSAAAEHPPADSGHVFYARLVTPELDRFTNSPNKSQQQWFASHFFRMRVFTPYFDSRTAWYPNALVYINLYGVDPGTSILQSHPEWILHDAAGRMVYVPYDCKNGSCARYAGDVSNEGFRRWWIGEARRVLARGHYRGLWLDDVNMEFRVGDGSGKEIAPIDPTTRRPMTWDAWRSYIAAFTEEIRAAFPDVEIDQNPIWFAGPQPARDRDSSIQRQIKSADNINIERGVATDQGLTGGTGEFSLHTLFDYIDRVHALGPGVTIEEYDLDDAKREYALAAYFLISTGRDRIGDGNTFPNSWWRGYETELGAPLGPRTYRNGVYSRSFARGMVFLGEPGLHPQNIPLPNAFSAIDGRKLTTVQLSARQGIVLSSTNQ